MSQVQASGQVDGHIVVWRPEVVSPGEFGHTPSPVSETDGCCVQRVGSCSRCGMQFFNPEEVSGDSVCDGHAYGHAV